ncbi:MAG TPA: GAF domain-containing sensor histidine kinase [Patescibacteria group bacterium]|nr:GAF domain-containing sensor histidine kinase [Patescibacteria group bacterium]
MSDSADRVEVKLERAAVELHAWSAQSLRADGVQVWVNDDLGFHPRIVMGRPFDDVDRAIARHSCIDNTLVVDGLRLSVPLELSDRRSGACLFSLSRPCVPSDIDAAQQRVHALHAELDEGLLLQRLSRLSGSARQSDQMRAVLALAHTLEHCPDKHSVLADIHRLLCGLVYAENFFVVVLDETRSVLAFEYFVDQFDRDEDPIPFVKGALEGSLSAFIVAAGRVLRGSSEELLAQAGHGDRLLDRHFGPSAHDWLGVPMVVANEVLGAVVIQSYDPAIRFTDADPSILSMLAESIGAAMHRRRVREALERTVLERTAELAAAKEAAEQALQHLQSTQAQLVQAEKMASLGQLVAGVAHEANTPLGVALTASSYLHQELQHLQRSFANGQLKPAALDEFLRTADEAARMVVGNLDRASRLIQNFKQVSVDRTSDGRRRFPLDAFLRELMGSIASLWRQSAVSVTMACTPGITLDSFPGALGQVLTNLVHNALLHAFGGDQPGAIRIDCRPASANHVDITVSDDGCGIDPQHQQQIFDPFFTTKRNQGGTGLGLHIVFNLVTQKLGGDIAVVSQPGVGTRFDLRLPITAPQ